MDSNIYSRRNLQDAVEVGRSFVHFVHSVVVPEEGERIDSLLPSNSGRGLAKKSKWGGEGTKAMIVSERSGRERGLLS